MFTGIIEEIGQLRSLRKTGEGAEATLSARAVLGDLKPGDSIAVSGACVTAVRIFPDRFTCDLSAETLDRTTLGRLKLGSPVNLERATLPTTRMGGHLVLGHVDGLGRIASMDHRGDGAELTVEVPAGLSPTLVDKGSVAVDGISLTPFGVERHTFRVAVIPTTLRETTLGAAKVGDVVNIETDVMAKYARGKADGAEPEGVTWELLQRAGFLD